MQAAEILARARAAGDAKAISLAERVLGLAARQRHDLAGSAAHFRRSIIVAEQAGLATDAAETRLSLIGTLALSGDAAAALAEADRAAAVLKGAMRARLETQRAHVHLHQGKVAEALEGFRRALPVLRWSGDRLGEARLYDARAMAHHLRGDASAAEADLRRAADLFEALGERESAAAACVHLGLAVAVRGDIPEALSWFDRAEQRIDASATIDAMALVDRSEVLLGASLVAEARSAAEMAVRTLEEQGQHAYLAIALVKLAEAALAAGDATSARAVAEQARSAFVQQRRPSWALVAQHLSIRAAWLDGERSPQLLAASRAAAAQLLAAGFASSGLDARLLAARLALDLGRNKVARRELDLVRASRLRAPVQLRVQAWYAEALLRLADGNRRGAQSALLAGVRLLDAYRAVLGATELRAHASGHGADLTQLALRLAVADGSAKRVLEWAERWRAGCLRLRPARPPDDKSLAASLAELRSLVTRLNAAAHSGKPTGALQARQAALEEVVRNRARHATGVLAAVLAPSPTASTLRRSTGEHALLELVDDQGMLHAVVAAGGRITLRRLAMAADVTSELDRLLFALRRLAIGRASRASLSAAVDAVAFGAKRLDDLMVAPVASAVADRPVVVIPTGALHAAPWSILPSFAGRPLSVAPSAALWLRVTAESNQPLENAHAAADDVVLVAGPALPHAETEIAALAQRYPAARSLTGTQATCENVRAALDGARLAHIAAHGSFRADNPLFSSLHLEDGPLTVYDLERLDRAPQTLILSACDSGLSDVHPGDELMGLTAALLALGTRTLVASVLPVPDAGTRSLMLTLHAEMHDGAAPAVALARAQAAVSVTGPAGLAAAAGFVCFGAGSVRVL